MRVLVISDIHANLTALEAVLADAGQVDAAWCLGDVVGYGPDPNECILRVKELPNLECILGNHDAASLNHIGVNAFNPEARQAIYWTQRVLTEQSTIFLRSRPEKVVIGEVTLAHGSPRQPVWEYVMDPYVATQNFSFFETTYCFIGHTHLPVRYNLEEGQLTADMIGLEPNQITELKPRAIINPGSVGQPRDRDPRASFAIYDTDAQTWDYRRIAYDIRSVQERMIAARLPERHIVRLEGGW
jgi:predicted phosphodiesterase